MLHRVLEWTEGQISEHRWDRRIDTVRGGTVTFTIDNAPRQRWKPGVRSSKVSVGAPRSMYCRACWAGRPWWDRI